MREQHRRILSFALAMLATIVCLSRSVEASTAYTAVSSGAWSSSSTWTPPGVPGSAPGDTANIPATFTVTMDYAMPSALSGFTNNGTINFLAGTLRLGNGTNTNNTSITMNSGALVLSGTLTLAAPAQFVVSNSSVSGGGTVDVQPSAGMTIGANFTLDSVLIDNAGTIVYNGSSGVLTMNSSAIINTKSGGVFDLQHNGGFTYSSGGQPEVDVASGGTLKKTTTTGTTSFGNVKLVNAGTVSALLGTIQIPFGASTGTFQATLPATIDFSSSTHTLNGASIGGDGVRLNGGALNGTGLTINGGATLTWSSGSMSGGTTTIAALGTLAITGPVTVDGRTITNNGTTILNNGGADFQFANSAVFNNNGVFEDQNTVSGRIVYAYGTGLCAFNNTGTFKKTAGAAAAFSNQGGGNMLFNNDGTVDAQLGTINVGYGTSTGLFTVTGSGFVQFVAPHTMNGATVGGSGGVRLVNGGTLQGPSFIIPSGAVFSWNDGTMAGASTDLTTINAGGTLSIIGLATLNGRTINNNGTTILNNAGADFQFANSAVFNNNSIFDDRNTVDGRIVYSSGTGLCAFNNIGTFKKTAGSAAAFSNQGGGNMLFNNSGTVDAQTGTINIAYGTSNGLFTVTGSGFVQFVAPHTMNGATVGGSGGVRLVNGGNIQGTSFVVPSSATLTWNDGTMSGASTDLTTINAGGTLSIIGIANLNGRTLNNNGTTIFNNGGADFNFANSAVFNNNSVFDEQNTANARIVYSSGTGPCKFNNGGTFKKTAGAGATFSNQGGGNMLFDNNGIVNAQTGTINIAYGTSSGLFTAAASGFVQFVAPHTMNGATVGGSGGVRLVTGGVIQGPSFTVPASATLTWNDGTMSGSSSDVTTIDSGGILSIAGLATLDGRTIINNGTTIFNNGGADFRFGNSAAFHNNGVFDDQNTVDGRIVYSFGTGPCNFYNGGTLKKTAGSTAAFSNQGGGNMLFNNTGIVDAQVGTINVADGTSTGLFTVTGSGVVQFVSTHTMNGATVGGSGGVRLVTGGNILGSNFIVPSGATLAWNGGSMSGASSDLTTINSGGTLKIIGPATLNARTINNNGTTIVNNAAADFQFGNSAAFNNNGVFDDRNAANARIVYAFGTGPCTFNNGGTLTKTAGSATFSFQGGGNMVVTNAGTVQAQTGALSFGPFTQSAGTTTAGPGSLVFGSGMNLNGGVLNGTGTISGDVINSGGAVNPGTSPGALTISGNYNQGSSGSLNIELSGTAPGTQYDRLTVTGTATLAGNLNVALIGGYTPNNGDNFQPLLFGSRSGDFITPYNLPTFPGGTFTPSYTATTLNLAVAVSSDPSVSQSVSLTALHGQNVTYTITVSNGAIANATGVVLTDTFTGGAFGSFTTSQGSCSGSGPITCNLGTIPVNSSATVTVTLNATTAGTMSNTASITLNENDPNTANNTAASNVTVNPAANLSIGITDSPDPVNSGANSTYTVTLTNGGPDPAASVSVGFTLFGGSIASVTSAGLSCSGTGGSATCTAATLAPGPYTITVIGTAGASGTMTLNGVVTSSTGDPSPGGENASQSTTISATDLVIVKNGPANALPGTQITYTLTVTNLGSMVASTVVVNDVPPSRLTFVSNSGACTTPFPCAIPSLGAGQSFTISATYSIAASGSSPITNVANVTALTTDTNSSNNTSSVTTAIGCPTTIPNAATPADGAVDVPVNGTLNWTTAGATRYDVFLGPVGSGCTTAFAVSATNGVAYSGLKPGTDYEWRVEAGRFGCPVRTSACAKFRTASTCTVTPPVLLAPVNGSAALSPLEFKWSAVTGATEYQLWMAAGGGTPVKLTSTTGTTYTATAPDGPIQWYVIALVPDCGPLQSATGSFNYCNRPDAPVAGVVGQATTGQTYKVEWPAVQNAVSFEIEESESADFSPSTKKSVQVRSVPYVHITDVSKAFYYRVRAFGACSAEGGPFSEPIRVVIIPLPPRSQKNPSVNVPAGNTDQVIQEVFIPGQANQTLQYSATVNRPWLSVAPPNGVLPPEGVTLKVTASPGQLPNGTFTASLVVVITAPSSSRYGSQGSSTVTVPVSVNVVTPVSPVTSRNAPAVDSLIIPSIGHLDGVNSHWQSDIRVTNVSGQTQKYALIFSPSDPKGSVKQTTIDVGAGATTALDDIVRTWYGIGTLGDAASGILEIRPLASAGKGSDAATPAVSRATLVSSRTYNATSTGTLGQFIPAIPFTSFIARAAQGVPATVLSMQQIAQSSAFRTNVGVIEAAGQSASIALAVFDDTGKKLLDLPFDLKANQQLQLNGILAQNNIAINDGRIEVRVTKGDGRVTAYASTIDNLTNDPLLVAPVQIGQSLASKWVVPGVADLASSLAHWQTDMRLFNSGSNAQSATLTFLPQGGGEPSVASVTIPANQVAALDAVVSSLFARSNAGGMVQVTTPADAALIISGRTYNQTSNGTLGQFTPAVTLAEGASLQGRSLNILQVEDSVRYRTNLGLAELSGKPVTVEVQVVLPDSKVTPTVQIPLAANEFRQSPIIRELGLGDVYNARLNIRVISGEGVVTAYGSVIDQETQDPTYVTAQ